jgi:hypothetical protein
MHEGVLCQQCGRVVEGVPTGTLRDCSRCEREAVLASAAIRARGRHRQKKNRHQR